MVSGEDGLGEVTLAGTTRVTQIENDVQQHFDWQPQDFGLESAPLDSIQISTPEQSAELIRQVLAGEPGPARDIVVLNAGAGLIAAAHCKSPTEAAQLAATALDNGAAASLLQNLTEVSHQGC